MTKDKHFATLLQDLAVVFAHADTHELLKKDVIPAGFHESNPQDIVTSWEKFSTEKPTAARASVASKLASLAYSKPYDLYHDIKITCAAEIVQHPVGSDVYRDVDDFFRISTETLLREVGNHGLQLSGQVKKEDASAEEALALFKEDFEKISSSMAIPTGEIMTHIHKYEEPVAPTYHSLYSSHTETKTVTQPLFSGLIGKSVLDTRNTVVPDPYLMSKVLGTVPGAPTSNNALKSFTSPASRMPPLTLSSMQILDSFFHPNWYTIEAPKWLTYKQKTLKPPVESTLVKNYNSNELRVLEKKSNVVSFAPTTDLKNAVLSDQLKTSVWFNNIGMKKLGDIKRAYLEAKNGADVAETTEVPETNGDIEEEKDTMEIDEPAPAHAPASSSNEIKVTNLAHFRPEAFKLLELLKKEKAKLGKSPLALQKLISSKLLQLNKLRQERYLHSTSPGTPSAVETGLYQNITKLITLLLKSKGAADTKFLLELSKKLPVLFSDYQGVLPGPAPSKGLSSLKTGRLPGIRGAYKKKGRFL